MAIFKKQTLSKSFPAYDIYEREADSSGYVNITADDSLGLDSGRGFFREYSPGSVVSYALQYNECPMAAVERAKANRHALHWINARAVAITAHAQAKRHLIAVRPGMRVRFEGLLATIELDHNNNLRFAAIKE